MAQLPTTRSRHSVVSSGGKLYVLGGWINGAAQRRLDEYDPATNQWTRRADMLTGRWSFGAAKDGNGRIYAIGGATSGGLITLSERYDPGSDTWTSIDPLPEAVAAQAAADLPNGDVLIAGGQVSFSLPDGLSNRTYIYNVAQGHWGQVTLMSAPRFAAAGALASNGRAYVVGGSTTGFNDSTALVEEYDPSTGSWAIRSSMLTSRYTPSIVSDGGQLFVFGGLQGGIGGTTLFSSEVYSPASNQWTTIAPMPTARSHAGAGRALPGWLLAIAGDGASSELDSVEDYRVSSNTWGSGVPPTATPTATLTMTPTLTPTATLTPTVTPTATPTATFPPCALAARPRVNVFTTRIAANTFDARVITLDNPTVIDNQLQSIAVVQIVNAFVTIGSQVDKQSPFSVSFPAGTHIAHVIARRHQAGQPMRVDLVVSDSCGPWPTFFGAGVSAF